MAILTIPDWVQPEEMLKLGYILNPSSSISGYYKYYNKLNVVGNTYGPMPIGKRLIQINASDYDKYKFVFVGIKEDGGTRTVFNGICYTQDDLIKILSLVN